MVEKTKYYYSNCLIEAIKAKIKHPKQVRLTLLLPWYNEVFCPHVLWSDGEYDYDFGIEGQIPLFLAWTLHKGRIRCRSLGFNEKWKQTVVSEHNKKCNRRREEL